MQDVRDKLAKNIISLAAQGHARQDEQKRYRPGDADFYCPHCHFVIVRTSFEDAEIYNCPACQSQSRFIYWAKAKDQRNHYACLCPIN